MGKAGLVFMLAILFFFRAVPAHAYLDPGAGSMVLQIILGGFAGIAIMGKLFWKRLKAIFSFTNRKNGEE